MECAAAKNNPPGSERQKVGDLFTSYMDEARIEKLGMKPVLPRLEAVYAIKTKEDLLRTLAQLNKLGIGGPFGCGVTTDAKHSDTHILDLVASGTRPARPRLLSRTPKFKAKLAAYQVYLEKLLALAKIPDAKQAAADIVALETKIAKAQWSKVENRDADKTYNKMDLASPGQARARLRLEALLQRDRRQGRQGSRSLPSRRTSPRWPSCWTACRWRPGRPG